MSNKLPKQLSEKQELLRQQTINRVSHAITAIKAEGGVVTIAALVEYTGLSRSVFAKPHIRLILTEYGYGREESTPRKKQSKTKKEANTLSEKNKQIVQLQEKNVTLTKECELLRGRLLLLMQREHNR